MTNESMEQSKHKDTPLQTLIKGTIVAAMIAICFGIALTTN
jgi:hypothetical protein